MSEIERAFPAFPYPPEQTRLTLQLGMTLRDYFAAAALQGIVTGVAISGASMGAEEPVSRGPVARDAYKVADAMLAEREKP